MMCATRFFFAPLFHAFCCFFSGSQRGSLFYRAPFSYFRSAGFCSSYDRMVCVFVYVGLFVRFSRRFSFLRFRLSLVLLLLISEASIDDDGDHAKYRFHCLKCVCVCECVMLQHQRQLSLLCSPVLDLSIVSFPSRRSLYCSFPIVVSYASRCLNLETKMNERWMRW